MKTLNYPQSAKAIFKSVVKGSNFMTPDIIGFYKIKHGAVELSSGTGFSGSKMYGITVVKYNQHNHELSKCFYSLEEAKNYINSLK